MFRRRHRESFQELNTTSTADISFMLLIFFLVTSSMDTHKGLLRQLPPLPDEKEQPLDIQKDHVMTVGLDGQNQLSFDGTVITLEQLPEVLMQRIEGDRLEHVVAIETHRETTYEAYFHVQNAVVKAYGTLRDQRARKLCGKPYAKCGAEEREDIDHFYPLRISESLPKNQ
jgi:biopolymer transport protein ExbD